MSDLDDQAHDNQGYDDRPGQDYLDGARAHLRDVDNVRNLDPGASVAAAQASALVAISEQLQHIAVSLARIETGHRPETPTEGQSFAS